MTTHMRFHISSMKTQGEVARDWGINTEAKQVPHTHIRPDVRRAKVGIERVRGGLDRSEFLLETRIEAVQDKSLWDK